MLLAVLKSFKGPLPIAWIALLYASVLHHNASRHGYAQSFIIPPSPSSCRSLALLLSSSSTETVPTLSDTTTWRMRVVLRNIPTEQGTRIANEMFVITGQFREDEGYEPPQGTFLPQTTAESTSASRSMRIAQSRWKLSEDPNDRKDGLWVWGLFKEPLYPYMLFSFETLPILWNEATQDSIPSLQLYVQLNHTRNRETGAVSLSSNTLYDLKIRQIETIAADPLGVSKVDVYEEVSVGTFSIQPL